HFQILKSNDGVNFAPIGNPVAAEGGPQTPKNYFFDDVELAVGGGTVYYKLKIINAKDEETVHDQTIMIELASPDKELKLVPNPVIGNSELHYYSLKNETVSIKVVNVEGKTMVKKSSLVNIGYNKITLESSTLAAGVYTIAIQNEKGVETIKLI